MFPQPSLFGFTSPQSTEVHVYHKQDLIYTFDRSTDAQRAVQRSTLREATGRRGTQALYAAAYAEDTIPTYRFPSTRDVSDKQVYLRTSYKAGHRLFFVLDMDASTGHTTAYFEYRHQPQVDVAAVERELWRALQLLSKSGLFASRQA